MVSGKTHSSLPLSHTQGPPAHSSGVSQRLGWNQCPGKRGLGPRVAGRRLAWPVSIAEISRNGYGGEIHGFLCHSKRFSLFSFTQRQTGKQTKPCIIKSYWSKARDIIVFAFVRKPSESNMKSKLGAECFIRSVPGLQISYVPV